MVDGLRQTTFGDSFKMSTYLAAWAILPETYGRKLDDEEEPIVSVERDSTVTPSRWILVHCLGT